MAIKGKRKKSKGAAAKRRPAAAPRPAYSARRPPWYKTTGGRILAGGVVVTLAIVAIVLLANARSAQRELEAKQQSLESFTAGIEGLYNVVNPPVREMAGLFGGTPPPTLAEDSQRWVEQLQAVQTATAAITPTPETEKLNLLFMQSSNLYLNAAQLFLAASGIEAGREQSEVIARGGEVRFHADEVFQTAVDLLDELRAEAEMVASGLEAPLQGARTENPITITPPDLDQNDGGGNGKGGGGGGDG